MKSLCGIFFAVVFLSGCGGGGSDASVVDDSGNSNTDDSAPNDPSETTTLTGCSVQTSDFGGDLPGNEYSTSEQYSFLATGAFIGSASLTNSEIQRRVSVAICEQDDRFEIGGAFLLYRSFNSRFQVAIEIRNKTAETYCGILAATNLIDAAGADWNDFSGSHKNIGPFTSVQGSLGVKEDESGRFVIASNCLQPNETGYLVGLTSSPTQIGTGGFSERYPDVFNLTETVRLGEITVDDSDWTFPPPFSGSSIDSYDVVNEVPDASISEAAGKFRLTFYTGEEFESVPGQVILLDDLGYPLRFSYSGDYFKGASALVRLRQK